MNLSDVPNAVFQRLVREAAVCDECRGNGKIHHKYDAGVPRMQLVQRSALCFSCNGSGWAPIVLRVPELTLDEAEEVFDEAVEVGGRGWVAVHIYESQVDGSAYVLFHSHRHPCPF